VPPVSLLIKPVSGQCNLRCRYCFYHDVAGRRALPSHGRMSPETLERLVSQALALAEGACTFAFQGGEPTLAGLPFYETLLSLESRYNTQGVTIHHAIQTNGLLVDEAYAAFFARHGFLVGLSLDGGRALHDDMRVDAQGKGTFDRVMRAAELLDRQGADYNILCVVSRSVARHGGQVYDFLKKQGHRLLQFIPCLDDFDGAAHPHSLTPQRYTLFLKTVFDRYYRDFLAGEYVSVRLFDNYVGMLMGRPPECCGMSGVCSVTAVVEADGEVYPCDFYGLDEYRLGNIHTHALGELLTGERARQFVAESLYRDPKCARCRWFPLCRGGCRRLREPFAEGHPSLYRYCESQEAFFEYAYDRMRHMAAELQRRLHPNAKI